MLKIGAILAALGLVLLAASVVPWGAAPGGEGMAATNATGADYGRALFAAKGCAQCHAHAAYPRSGDFGGMHNAPDLTNRPADPAYQRAWLRDPRALKPTTAMPNLGLSEAEIDALVAFLQPATPSTR